MKTNKNSLYKEREKYRQKAFLMMLEVAVIIAIPAVVAAILGTHLDKNNTESNFYTVILLAFSFIFSWVIIIIKYKKFNKKVKEIDKQIKKSNVDNPNSGR